MFFFDSTYVLIIPGLLLGLYAQAKVKSAFKKYSKVQTRSGVPAQVIADRILRENGNYGVHIEGTSGSLTDHFDPRTDTLRLSQTVYNTATVASVGVAAHEAGHAMQKHEGSALMAVRGFIAPVVNIGSALSWPIFIVGLILSWAPLVNIGILLFSLVVLFALITLPLEFNASSRALKMLSTGGHMTEDELHGVKKVLDAAALTYVAALVSAALQLLRLMLLARNRE